MPTERTSSKDMGGGRTEVLDEPTGSIEFGPRRAAVTNTEAEAMGEDAKPLSSSPLGGREDAAVRKAEARARRRPARSEWSWRRLWNRLRGHRESAP